MQTVPTQIKRNRTWRLIMVSTVCLQDILLKFEVKMKNTTTQRLLALKAPRKKKAFEKITSAEVVCCRFLPNITDELSIEANSVDPEQTV